MEIFISFAGSSAFLGLSFNGYRMYREGITLGDFDEDGTTKNGASLLAGSLVLAFFAIVSFMLGLHKAGIEGWQIAAGMFFGAVFFSLIAMTIREKVKGAEEKTFWERFAIGLFVLAVIVSLTVLGDWAMNAST